MKIELKGLPAPKVKISDCVISRLYSIYKYFTGCEKEFYRLFYPFHLEYHIAEEEWGKEDSWYYQTLAFFLDHEGSIASEKGFEMVQLFFALFGLDLYIESQRENEIEYLKDILYDNCAVVAMVDRKKLDGNTDGLINKRVTNEMVSENGLSDKKLVHALLISGVDDEKQEISFLETNEERTVSYDSFQRAQIGIYYIVRRKARETMGIIQPDKRFLCIQPADAEQSVKAIRDFIKYGNRHSENIDISRSDHFYISADISDWTFKAIPYVEMIYNYNQDETALVMLKSLQNMKFLLLRYTNEANMARLRGIEKAKQDVLQKIDKWIDEGIL